MHAHPSAGPRSPLAEYDALRRLTTGDPRVCVAVLDGPVDLGHPCFADARLEVLPTLVPNSAGDDAASRHGTHVASVIFGRGFGLAPGCRGLVVPVFSPRGAGALKVSQFELARAVDQALARGAHVISISAGELTPGDTADDLLAQSLERCAQAGVLVVAAAGNDGCACVHLPAAHPSVLAVGAMDAAGIPLAFSNWGDAYRDHGVLAPGRDIAGAVPGDGLEVRTGTSFATAVVAGAAALLLSLQVRQGASPDPLAVRAAILATAHSRDPAGSSPRARLLAGRLNLPALTSRFAGPLPRRRVPPGVSLSMHHEQEEESMDHDSEIHDTATGLLDDHETDGALDALPENGVVTRAEVEPSGCGCGKRAASCSCGGEQACTCGSRKQGCTCSKGKGEAGGGTAGLVYVLGTIGYDFRHEARRDALFQESQRNLSDPAELLAYLDQNPHAAESLSWTVQLESAVAYAIRPAGAFAAETYERLRELLGAQVNEGADRVSVPGVVRGAEKLASGQSVPRIFPELRGMYSWNTPALARAVLGEAPADSDEGARYAEESSAIGNFLDRIYYELRNFGITPQDRALNFAATNAFQASSVFHQAIRANLQLDCIEVERSPACRPGADCWDVKLVFFNASRRMEQARRVFRFTVDVSDVVPVTIGRLRSWDMY